MGLLTVYDLNNTKLGEFDPSAITWGLQDVSASDAGRTQTGKMYKQRIAQKIKLGLTFNGISSTVAAQILTAFNDEYIKVRYPDAMSGGYQTRTFYVGDRSAPAYMYTVNKKIYQNISFDIIER